MGACREKYGRDTGLIHAENLGADAFSARRIIAYISKSLVCQPEAAKRCYLEGYTPLTRAMARASAKRPSLKA
jgi:hypothetical protein